VTIPKPKDPLTKTPAAYLQNTIARHILLNKAYPKALPKIPSINNSLPAVMKHFGGLA
jgi:hypothetical protein